MHIKVLKMKSEPEKAQGDLLERFVTEWIERLNYSVVQNIRLTAAELDLLCKEAVSGKEIYVECKAYNETNWVAD